MRGAAVVVSLLEGDDVRLGLAELVELLAAMLEEGAGLGPVRSHTLNPTMPATTIPPRMKTTIRRLSWER